jgi:hypothetical protein
MDVCGHMEGREVVEVKMVLEMSTVSNFKTD